MSHVTCHIAISLDGYVAGPNQSMDDPLGEGGMRLHEWVLKTDAWREQHGQEGGERNPSSDVVEEVVENVGAYIMGRNMFGAGRGEWDPDVARLVGRGPAVPRARLRAHPPPARVDRDAGRHDVPLRHRRHRVRARAGARRRGRPRRLDRRRREHGPAVPRRPASSTSSTSTSPRSSSAPASGCSTTSATRRSSPSRSSPRPTSRTSSTASCTRHDAVPPYEPRYAGDFTDSTNPRTSAAGSE